MGRAQAAAFYQAYQHIAFDKIYTSALKRTHQTVEAFLEHGLPHEILPGLNEISWGLREGKIPNNLDNEYYRELIESWAAGRTDLPTEDGESPNQVMERQKVAIDAILSHPEEETILVAMHGRAMRILLAWITGQPLSTMDQFEHSNLCLYILTYSYETKSFTIEVSNDSTHLMALVV